MTRLLCITGIDGSGKNTLIEKIREKQPSVYVANIWDAFDGAGEVSPFRTKRTIDKYLCGLTPDSRLLFLAHAIKYSVDAALKSDAKIVLLNAYYYKYFATELALGADKNLVLALIRNFPIPDEIYKLVLDPEEAGKRKTEFSRYECGTAERPDFEQFVAFQKKAIGFWETYDQRAWENLNALLTPQELFSTFEKLI